MKAADEGHDVVFHSTIGLATGFAALGKLLNWKLSINPWNATAGHVSSAPEKFEERS